MTGLHLSQKEIYFDQVSDSTHPHYNIGTYIVIKGQLDVDLLKHAITGAVDVFDVFCFKAFSNDAPCVQLHESPPAIPILELDRSNEGWSDDSLKEWLLERINKPFPIYTGHLYDFVLIKRKKEEHWLYMGCHHLFSDGYGVPYVFLSYVFDKYHALRTGAEKFFQYPSYLQLMTKSNDYLETASYEADRSYWQQRFSTQQEPILQKRPTAASFRTETIQLFFAEQDQQRLRAFCLENELSLQDFLIAVLTVYYKKANAATIFDFCLPVHNRNDRRERQTLGVFSKLIPCRIETDDPTLKELFKQIKTNQRQDYRHKQFPVSHFNRMILTEKNNASKPFDICVNYRYFKLVTIETELDLKGFRNDASYSKTPLEFSWSDFSEKGKEELFLEIIFRKDYFEKEEMELLAQRVLFVMDQFYTAVNDRMGSIEILPGKEREKLLFGFNDTATIYPSDKTIIDLFEEQVEKTPDHIAVICEDRQLTYQELDERSDQLAAYLQENYAIGANDFVGIKQERSEWMISAVLGVLKAGGAYVPIDLAYPQERIAYIEKDTNCKACLDSGELNRFREVQENYSKKKPVTRSKAEDLAYVIYTSGSTGNPKGVLIEHRNASAFINWCHDEFKDSAIDTVLFTTSLNFDLSVFEIFYPLTTGKELKVLKDGLSIPAALDKNKRQLINTVPSVVGFLLQENMRFDAVSVLNMAGEPIPSTYRTALKGKIKEIRNLYGPSEDTTYSTSIRMDQDDRDLIGKPISNTQVFILSEAGDLQPIGLMGEICISGDGLARGYLNQEELTSKKFVAHPFMAGARLYKTGDLGRWLPDGNIELAGRKDDQVKIRGYRIELGEIEHVLRNHKDITAAVVIAKQNNAKEKELVAYLTSKIQQHANELRAYLKEKLPEFMIPAYYVQLDELPLTSNGKIDKKSLPDPHGLGLTSGEIDVAPRNNMEEKLVSIWENLLHKNNIGIRNDFFSLGGHSLKATQLISEYHQAFDVKLTLSELFKHSTIESHCQLLTASKKEIFKKIDNVTLQESYPLSGAQRRLWVLSQFEETAVAYNMPGSLRLNGNYDLSILQRAFESVIARHEILRTVFREDETGTVKQWVLEKEDIAFTIAYRDLRKEQDKEAQVSEYIAADAYRPFDLEKGPLLRAALMQLEEDRSVFYFNMHHIISDGWSMDVLRKDVFSYYAAYSENKDAELKPLSIQYKDYSAWALGQLQGAALEADRSYWLENLSGELPLLDLPASKQRPKIKTNNGHALCTHLDEGITDQLKKYSQTNGGSLFMGLLAVWNVLMYRYTHQRTIITGTPVAGRSHADLDDQIGCYVNTLALKNEIRAKESFNDFYEGLKDRTLKSFSHQLYPFDQLVEELDIKRDTGRSAVFDILLTFQNSGIAMDERYANVDEGIADLGYSTCKFDIDITFHETANDVFMQVVYNTDVYDREMMEGLMRHYRQLLEALLRNPSENMDLLDFLSEGEKQEQLLIFNDTEIEYPVDETIVSLFQDQVIKTPDNIAVVFGKKMLTYRVLHQRSNQLARYLQKQYAIGADDLVGIKQERSEWMIISILAVLKSGCAYVPIDPSYPQERIDYILSDSRCKAVIDERELARFRKEEQEYTNRNLKSLNKPRDLAYVIYTSGSTGKPKGVMVEHSGVVNLIYSQTNTFAITETERILQFSSYSFDASVEQIFLALFNGATLVLVPKEILLDTGALEDFIKEHQVTHVHATPAFLETLNPANCMGLRRVIAGGDVCRKELQEKWSGIADFYNEYGPTETTVTATEYYCAHQQQVSAAVLPIGKPLANTCVYILTDHLRLSPKGVTAEICIGGAGVARGYLNQEELTRDKFIANPFKEGDRLYKTGDLGRWLPDGNIAFAGRKDDQVKIRGYRIELGEIEQCLQKHGQVKSAVVIAKENPAKEKELVAYITAENTQTISELRNYLKELLPEYMLPSYYIQLESLPLNSNGKVDRKRLPDPQGMELIGAAAYTAPENEPEKELVLIWEEILQRGRIGIHDDFFELGGQSLKAIQLIAAVRKRMGVHIVIRNVFEEPTIAKLAAFIERKHKETFQEIPAVHSDTGYALSSSQLRMWILSQHTDGNIAYNSSGTFVFEGGLDIAALNFAFAALMQRHEILRTVFMQDDEGEVKQFVKPMQHVAFRINDQDLRHVGDQQIQLNTFLKDDSSTAFDLQQGPLFKISLYQTENSKWIFNWVVHHIISDGWSIKVMIGELLHFYTAFKRNEKFTPDPLRIQYKDYAEWQQKQLREGSLDVHRQYWLNQFKGVLPSLTLKGSKPRPVVKTYNGAQFKTRILSGLCSKLKLMQQKQDVTMFMSLLTLVTILLSRRSGQRDFIIGSPIAGREHADLENQLGCYLNILPLRTGLHAEENFLGIQERVKQLTLDAYEHQVYPFDELVKELNQKRDLSRNVLFDVLVVLQNIGSDPLGSLNSLEGLTVSAYEEKQNNISQLDLAFEFTEIGNELELVIEYNTDLFDRNDITNIADELEQLIAFVSEQPTVPVMQFASGQDKPEEASPQFNAELATPPKIKRRTLINDL